MKYATIVADPPWDHEDGTGVDLRTGARTGLSYRTMNLGEIAALPVRDLSDNVGTDAHLYLWTTSRYLRDAFAIAQGWGFHYAAALVWCKPSRGFSVGGAFQNNVEFVLFCRRPGSRRRPDVLRLTTAMADHADRRGISRADIDRVMGTSDMGGWWLSRLEHRCACPTIGQWAHLRDILGMGDEWDAIVTDLNEAKGERVAPVIEQATSRWFDWPRGAHSAKPEAFLDIVEQVSPGPYLEMFARRARFGWDYWGDQSLGTAEMPKEAA